MNNLQIRKLNKYQAERAFMVDNAASFPDGNPGARTTAALGAEIDRILSLAGAQVSGAISRSVGVKDGIKENLIKLMQKMNRAAASMADEIDSIEDLFRMPRRRSEEAWLAAARAFYNDSAAYEAQFEEYGLPDDFRASLIGLITSLENAASEKDVAQEQRGGATGGLTAAFREAGKLSRKLKGIVENKFADDPQKLAAWLIASHMESADKPNQPEPVLA